MTERLTIIEKIEKLLRKAESTEHEAERDTFIAKAQQLMQRHAVEQAELSLAGQTTEPVVQRQYTYSTNDANLPGKRALLSVCCGATGVKFAYYSGMRTHQLATMVGFETDIEVAIVMYESLLHQARRAADADSCTAKRDVTAHMVGFAAGVDDKLAEIRAAESTTSSVALVLVNRAEEVEEAFNQLGSRTGRGYSPDQYTAARGVAAGRRADVGQRRIAN